MAPIKFEENIKGKLDKRTFQPSTEAWNKLSERLDEQDKKGNNKMIWGIGLAASIVGVLFVVSQMFNTNNVQEMVPQVVDTPKVEPVLEQENNVQIVKEDVETIKKPELEKPKNVIAITHDNMVTEDKVVVPKNVIPELKSEISKTIAIESEKISFEDATVKNVAAKIQELQNRDKVVTDETIDALLLQAQKEITINKLYNESTRVVDAHLLLQDVEADLDRSFRTKVFETLKASYNTVKTAVAQRND